MPIREGHFKRALRFDIPIEAGKRRDKLAETNEQIFIAGITSLEEKKSGTKDN